MNFESKDGRTLDVNEPLRVYRNLNNGKLSVQQIISIGACGKKDWRVIGWVDSLQLENVTTYFNRNKQQKAVNEVVRNVHAYIVGYAVGSEKYSGQNKELTYNPFKYSEFVNRDTKENVYKAETLHISKDGKMFYQ